MHFPPFFLSLSIIFFPQHVIVRQKNIHPCFNIRQLLFAFPFKIRQLLFAFPFKNRPLLFALPFKITQLLFVFPLKIGQLLFAFPSKIRQLLFAFPFKIRQCLILGMWTGTWSGASAAGSSGPGRSRAYPRYQKKLGKHIL